MPVRHRIGWMLFLVSAVLFAVDGAASGNWWVLAASVVFGAACVLFLAGAD